MYTHVDLVCTINHYKYLQVVSSISTTDKITSQSQSKPWTFLTQYLGDIDVKVTQTEEDSSVEYLCQSKNDPHKLKLLLTLEGL